MIHGSCLSLQLDCIKRKKVYQNKLKNFLPIITCDLTSKNKWSINNDIFTPNLIKKKEYGGWKV